MKPRRVGLVDIGLDDAFDESMAFVQGIMRSINAGVTSAVAEVDFVRSRDWRTITAALSAKYHVLHVMAHGDHSEEPTFFSTDTSTAVSLEELAQHLQKSGQGLQTGAILADGCKTGVGVWQQAFRQCLQGDVTYIGTSANVGWHEGTVFMSAFYGSLFRSAGAGKTPAVQAAMAGERAVQAYELLTDRKCPYKVMTLSPSRAAMKAFSR